MSTTNNKPVTSITPRSRVGSSDIVGRLRSLAVDWELLAAVLYDAAANESRPSDERLIDRIKARTWKKAAEQMKRLLPNAELSGDAPPTASNKPDERTGRRPLE